MPPDAPDGPRRYVPVPGLVDLDALDAGAPDADAPAARPADPAERATHAPPAPAPPALAATSASGASPPLAPAGERPPSETGPPQAVHAGAVHAAADPGQGLPVDAAAPSPALAVAPEAPEAPAAPLVPAAVLDSAREAARSRGRELVALVVDYGRRHLPETPPRPRVVDAGPPKLVGRLGSVLPFLKAIPWLLAVAFAASFVWDTPTGLVRVLSVSGLIGFLTNWLAITMLFQPREKRVLIPQGLIPAQRERVIYRLSEAISRELINADIIKQKIQESGMIGRYRDLALGVVRGVVEDPGFRADLKALASDYAGEVLGSEAVRRDLARVAVEKVEQQAGQGLGGMALRLYRTFAEDDFQRRVDRALAELPQAITPLLDRVDAALDAVPARAEARADEIEEMATRAVLSFVEGFDVQAMIAEKARGFDEAQLEGLLKSTSNEQLNYIQYLGGILGVVGGFVIWRPGLSLAILTSAALALWGLDELLVRMRRRG